MTSFLGFRREHVAWNYKKTGNPVYLHIVQRQKPEPNEADRPLKKPTLLAIGVEGGFSDQETECDEVFEIIILHGFFSLPFPSVDLPEKVTLYSIQEIIGQAEKEFRVEVEARIPQQRAMASKCSGFLWKGHVYSCYKMMIQKDRSMQSMEVLSSGISVAHIASSEDTSMGANNAITPAATADNKRKRLHSPQRQ
ncbi:hypothetical protein ABZP36_000464 [Zizania latifolia]